MNKKLIIAVLLPAIVLGAFIIGSFVIKPTKTIQPNMILVTPSISQEELTNQQTQTTASTSSAEISLTISEPLDNEIINTSVVAVKGTTLPDASVFVNDKELKADAKGAFSTSVSIDEGENIISIVANDENGNFMEKELTVILESVE